MGCFSDKRTNEDQGSIKNTPYVFSETEKKQEIQKIKEVLFTQQKHWNNGDLDGFMQGYWNSEELIFSSAKHKPAYGWKATLERYKESYPTKESMGEFKFEIDKINLNSNATALVSGKWEIIRIDDHPKGWFQLTFEKFGKKWLITKDFTLSY